MRRKGTFMYKILFLILLLAQFAYNLVLKLLSDRQIGKALPASVADLYDAEEYARFRRYESKKDRLGLISRIVSLALNIALFCTDLISVIYYALPGGEIAKAILFFLIVGAVEAVIGLPFDYVRNFKIEAEFGFNKLTAKTFIADTIKNFILGTVLTFVIFMLVFGAYALLGAWFGIAAIAALGIFMFAVSSLSTVFSKIFNKFTPLPEGKLRDDLCRMFSDAGYKLKDIYVMDASKRTTHANAYCGGIGKFKQIVLFDNLVNNYTDEEITAVFAHELAHFKHKDTTKMTLFNLINFVPMIALMAIIMAVPQISASFGFAEPTVLFAFYVGFGGVISIVTNLIMIPFNYISRRMERRADTFAQSQGYGEGLATGLKKLHKDSLSDLNPHPTVVKLTYSHPPLHERLELVGSLENKEK